ncbi:MAG: nitrogenase reductase [Myxococcales bacterium]|nr:nitrogenase reductase [Myxococcales bacterium]
MNNVQKIAVYGKGGIGKSVVATALSAHFAQQSRRVLHVGCDPKADSAVRLIDGDAGIRTVLDAMGDDPTAVSTEQIITRGRLGIDCCEAGGPKPGLGCGGRGVARTLEFLDEMDVIDSGDYDVVLFDVLGDVVCGGFAAPLRRRFAEKVVIVTSEEPMAIFAANNISKAVEVYAPNGIALAGIVGNLRTPDANRGALERFAEAIGTEVLAFIPRDPKIQEAEVHRQTIVEYAPETESSAAIRTLAAKIEGLSNADLPLPRPMEDKALFEFLQGM